ADKVIAWALETYKVLVALTRDSCSGVSMIELRQFSRTAEIQIPDWANSLSPRRLSPPFILSDPPVISTGNASPARTEKSLTIFSSGFSLTVPLMDTTIYLDYLANRFRKGG